MFLSIIIPVYNMEKYLKQCLDSCLNQNLDYKEYELICINDGSEDKSLAILQEYASQYPNIVVIDQKNQGVSAARNNGISRASADYIWFVDSDDMIKPNCLQVLKDETEKDCGIITFNGYSFSENWTEEEALLLQKNQLVGDMTYWGFVAVHIYNRKIIQNGNICFNSEISYGEDELFYINVLERVSSTKNLPDVFYLYRQHGNSSMNLLRLRPNRIKRLHSVITSMFILKNGLENKHYVREETVNLLKARYEVCPYLLAEVDRKTAAKYWKLAYEYNLFNKEFTEKYGLLSEKQMLFQFRKERFVDKRNEFLKKIIPQRMIMWIKQKMKK